MSRHTIRKINMLNVILKQKNCLGFMWRFSNSRYGYITTNDWQEYLNDIIDIKVNVVEKIELGHNYYVYQIEGGWPDNGTGLRKDVCIAKIKTFYPTLFKLTQKESKRL